jgi:ribosomal protein S12 methylthiotransferase accessory factor
MNNDGNNPFSLRSLKDAPPVSLQEALERAQRLVSHRAGIIADVDFVELAPEEPQVYWARSHPADVSAFYGRKALNFGTGASADPNRAIIKAVGESIERYCSAQYDENEFCLATYDELEADAVPPQNFALFSEKQYAQVDFPFSLMTQGTPLRWVQGHSLTRDKSVWTPATFVYVPYAIDPLRESKVQYPISTGMACAPNLATAIYKGTLEAIERDAFMITWHNRLSRPLIDLASVDDPYARRLLGLLEGVPVRCHACFLSLDIPVPIILVVLSSTSGRPPYTVVGLGTDLDPQRALIQALEEVYLGYWGMNRYALQKNNFKPEKNYSNVNIPIQHGYAHAIWPELRESMEFLLASDTELSIQDLPNVFNESMVANVNTLVDLLREKGVDVISKDLTTPDIDGVGFKVVRAVVPGLKTLDINHACRYLGGKRLYEVPFQMGLLAHPMAEEGLNPFPHVFP